MSLKFECDCCGACCKNIRQSTFYDKKLDRGDGVCRYLTADNLCSIYTTRPIFCNVDAYYEKFLSDTISREKYFKMNYEACERLKKI